MNLVQLVKIKNISPLYYKGKELATSVELVQFEENEWEVVVQKGLYKIGDTATFIIPDSNVPNSNLFESFYRPYFEEGDTVKEDGRSSKSRLGKNGRVRAIKFNHTKELGNSDYLYSSGLLLPMDKVEDAVREAIVMEEETLFIDIASFSEEEIQEHLNITKYETPVTLNDGKRRSFPEGLYKTGEKNIKNIRGVRAKFPMKLVGRMKADGSSITFGTMDGVGFVCSRNLQVGLHPTPIEVRTKKMRKETFRDKWLNWLSHNFGYLDKSTHYNWYAPNVSAARVDLHIYEEQQRHNAFGKAALPYVEALQRDWEADYILRGELVGKGGSKGSGNSKNPHAALDAQILVFGGDKWVGGESRRISQADLSTLVIVHNNIEANPKIVMCEKVLDGEYATYEELMRECSAYFAKNMVEGIVVRNEAGDFSAKIMNERYDAKKA